MKKYFRKAIASIMAVALMVVSVGAIPALQTKAATKEVTIFYQNSQKWTNVYCYTYYGSGAVGTAWPGQKMTDAGNGWVKATYTGDKPLNVVFSNNAKPTAAQTANHTPKDLPLTQSAYWFTNSASSSQNAGGMGGGIDIVVNTTAQAGWPTVAVATASSTSSTTSSTATSKDVTPKTGDNNTVAAVGTIGVISLAAAYVLLGKRKVKA